MSALDLRKLVGFYLAMGCLGLAAMGGARQVTLLPAPMLHAWVTAIGLGGLVGLGLVVASRTAAGTLQWVRPMVGEFRSLLGHLTPQQALWVALLSGLSEELLFRGALQSALGLGLSSCIFALMHIGPTRRFVPWTIMAGCGGLVFGLTFSHTGNLLAPTVAHVTVNYLNMRYLAGPRRMALSLRPAHPSGSLRL